MNAEIESLVADLATLRRSNHRLVYAVAALAVCLGLTWAWNHTPSARGAGAKPHPQTVGIVRTRGLELVDAHGRKRAELTADRKGCSLTLLDEHGRLCVKMVAAKYGSGVQVYSSQGIRRAELVVTPLGPRMNLCNARGECRVGMSALDRSGVYLSMYDADGRWAWGHHVVSPAR